MAFNFDNNWNGPNNNNGASKEEVTTILKTAKTRFNVATGDAGLVDCLSKESDQVTVEKGIHDKGPHIKVTYLGGTYHVDLVVTAAGGRAGYRVTKVTSDKVVKKF